MKSESPPFKRTRYTIDSIKGKSGAIIHLKKEVKQATQHSLPVLITGESGTGKEVIAQAIHNTSDRCHHKFVRINCAAIPRDLFESELFGYAKGAFTGALVNGKIGKFALANNGTIFLVEIGELPMEMQPKLLRVLEEKEFERIGGTSPEKTNFRVIAATNQNLEDMLKTKQFRSDLFFRLNVIRIVIPPLQQRPEDIIPLSDSFLENFSLNAQHRDFQLTKDAEKMLLNYDWPGNIRELFNVLERTLAALEGNIIQGEDLSICRKNKSTIKSQVGAWGLEKIMNQAEKNALLDALSQTDFNKARAAKLLGIHRTIIYRKMKKHSIPISV